MTVRKFPEWVQLYLRVTLGNLFLLDWTAPSLCVRALSLMDWRSSIPASSIYLNGTTEEQRIAQRAIESARRYQLLTENARARAQCLPPLCRLDDYPPPYEAVRPPPPSITTTPAQQPAAKEIESLTCDEWFFANNDERQLPQPSRPGPDDPGRLSAEPTQPHNPHRNKRARFSHDSCEME